MKYCNLLENSAISFTFCTIFFPIFFINKLHFSSEIKLFANICTIDGKGASFVKSMLHYISNGKKKLKFQGYSYCKIVQLVYPFMQSAKFCSYFFL